MQYTVADGPQTVARITADLDLVRETVRSGDPALRSLVLTGGFARGEGAMMHGRPQNDYDLIAIRGHGRSRRDYGEMRTELEARLGLHIDLAPVGAWRIPLVGPSIFWYETAWRGRVLWGEDLLSKIPTRRIEDVDPAEGLRLLVNRAAGLLLATQRDDPHEHRTQAAKGLLAAFDAHLFASGVFPPSQTERWVLYQSLRATGGAPRGLEAIHDALEWAYTFKVDPEHAPARDADAMWSQARQAILDAVPVALRHAGLPSLDAYAEQDGLLDHAYYQWRAGTVPGSRRTLRHPTGRVRVATLRLLQAADHGVLDATSAEALLGALVRDPHPPLRVLEALRGATMQ